MTLRSSAMTRLIFACPSAINACWQLIWNPTENPEEVVSTLKKRADEKRIEENKSWAERDLERAKKAYEDAKKRYEIWKEVSDKKGVTV